APGHGRLLAPLRWSGRLSYELYLFHLIVLGALRALDRAGLPWRERFTGGGVAAVTAAAAAGLAVCPLARRVAPRTLVDVGAKFGLPPLPQSQVVLYSRVRDARAAAALRRFADSLAISA
ncbi:LysR family transcriptional regulator, partial [Burkholderia orbicola]|nr:LysR family transcriptional regulator [Burkholderia orbicola]